MQIISCAAGYGDALRGKKRVTKRVRMKPDGNAAGMQDGNAAGCRMETLRGTLDRAV